LERDLEVALAASAHRDEGRGRARVDGDGVERVVALGGAVLREDASLPHGAPAPVDEGEARDERVGVGPVGREVGGQVEGAAERADDEHVGARDGDVLDVHVRREARERYDAKDDDVAELVGQGVEHDEEGGLLDIGAERSDGRGRRQRPGEDADALVARRARQGDAAGGVDEGRGWAGASGAARAARAPQTRGPGASGPRATRRHGRCPAGLPCPAGRPVDAEEVSAAGDHARRGDEADGDERPHEGQASASTRRRAAGRERGRHGFPGLRHVPSVVILDKQGRERFRHLGLMTDVELGEVLDRF
jgi:hypothetical protein